MSDDRIIREVSNDRITVALESIARSLERMSSPEVTIDIPASALTEEELDLIRLGSDAG